MILITIEDLSPYLRDLPRNQITEGDDTLFDPLELAAISKAQSFTGRYFENDCLYPLILTYEQVQYVPGDYVNDSGVIYQVIATASPTHSISNTALFTATDPRNKMLMGIIIDCMLYDIHSRISPNQIPELRLIRYEHAITHLEKIADGLISGLPSECRIDTDGDGVPDTKWWSNTSINPYW